MKTNHNQSQDSSSSCADAQIIGVIALVMIFSLGMIAGFMVSILFFTLAF
jgi:hypothetical protein